MPNSTGGNAIGSPTFSDSSTRKTSGSRTRKPTTARTASVVRACPLMRGRRTPVGPSANGLAPGADDPVPLLGEGRAVLLEVVPVGGREQLHLLERHRIRPARRRHVLARRME